jgi:hypothetical protein
LAEDSHQLNEKSEIGADLPENNAGGEGETSDNAEKSDDTTKTKDAEGAD